MGSRRCTVGPMLNVHRGDRHRPGTVGHQAASDGVSGDIALIVAQLELLASAGDGPTRDSVVLRKSQLIAWAETLKRTTR